MIFDFDEQDTRTLKELIRTAHKHIHFEKEVDSVTGEETDPLRRLALAFADAVLYSQKAKEGTRLKRILSGVRDTSKRTHFEAVCKEDDTVTRVFAGSMGAVLSAAEDKEVLSVFHWEIDRQKFETSDLVIIGSPHTQNPDWIITEVPVP